jgi:hypothetical protein
MRYFRFISITSTGEINSIDVVTQLHYLLTPGESANPEATFWDLTIGGTHLDAGDQAHRIALLTSQRVSDLAKALQNMQWEELERVAESGCDMMPGWHNGLRPEFEKLREFMNRASCNGNAVFRVSSSDGFWYR